MVAAYCKECMSSYSKKWSKDNQEKRKASYTRNKSNPMNKLKTLLRVQHMDRTSLDFEWAWKKLETQNFQCEITGEPFTWGVKEPTTLSIDRIDPNKGYTKDNVRFVCWWVNTAMGNWGLEQVKELIKKWQTNGKSW